MGIDVPISSLERACLRFEADARRTAELAAIEGVRRKPRVITISRQLGSGGRRVAEALGEWLDWPVWDRQILDVLARQSSRGYQARMFEELDERAQSEIEAFLSSLFGQADKHLYFYYLPKAILTIAQHDAIIIGRGAHLLLPDSLKVRIVASLDTRVANLVRFEGLTPEEARRRIADSDRQREAFTQELVNRLQAARAWKPRTEFDLTICTDRLELKDTALLVLLAAARMFDLKLDWSELAASSDGAVALSAK